MLVSAWTVRVRKPMTKVLPLHSGRPFASGDPGPRPRKSERTLLDSRLRRNEQDRIRSKGTSSQAAAYAELAVTTNFSFLRGGSHPWEMVATADAQEGEIG